MAINSQGIAQTSLAHRSEVFNPPDQTGKFAFVVNDFGIAAYRIADNGALVPLQRSPFKVGFGSASVAITPVLPFASFLAKLTIYAGQIFSLRGSFTLGGDSHGINPVKERREPTGWLLLRRSDSVWLIHEDSRGIPV
jgi:hypothetical protein